MVNIDLWGIAVMLRQLRGQGKLTERLIRFSAELLWKQVRT